MLLSSCCILLSANGFYIIALVIIQESYSDLQQCVLWLPLMAFNCKQLVVLYLILINL